METGGRRRGRGDAVAPRDREVEHVLEAAEVEHRVVAAEARAASGQGRFMSWSSVACS
jgi:hypothetical protein